MDSLVERGYLRIPPIFETIPRTLALFVSVVISLVERVVEERDSFLAVTTSGRNAVCIDACLVFCSGIRSLGRSGMKERERFTLQL